MMAVRGGMVVNAYSNQSYMGDRWSDATATLADGCVILTPIESDQLFCLSLLDGKLLWKMDRGENVYVAGIQGGNVLLVGRKQVQAFKLADGKPAWSGPVLLPQGSMPSGRGFLSGDRLYLPLSRRGSREHRRGCGDDRGPSQISQRHHPWQFDLLQRLGHFAGGRFARSVLPD